MKKIFAVIISLVILSGCTAIGTALLRWQTKYPDLLLEETVEDYIEEETGVDIDLTPITGQEKQSLNSKVN